MTLDDRLARLALSQLGEPGDAALSKLVAANGAPAVYDALLRGEDPSGKAVEVGTRLAGVDPARDLDRATRLGIRWVVPGDEEWPAQVDDLDRAEPLLRVGRRPLGLWVKGPARLDELSRAVAVVGSRSATTYGESAAREIAATLVDAGFAVVSGAAIGIDHAAHRGALAAGGPTVAVLACGLDRAYPAAHKPLLDHLGAHHAVVSELAPGRSPTRSRFLSRNRVIAALGLGTVVVEAAIRSGALNTAGWTTRLNRALMVVPGPVTTAQSQGVHQLLRTGAATMVTSGADVLEDVGPVGEHLQAAPRAPEAPRDRLGWCDRRVLDAVPVSRPAGNESIARTAGLPVAVVATSLNALERLGLVAPIARGWRLARGGEARAG